MSYLSGKANDVDTALALAQNEFHVGMKITDQKLLGRIGIGVTGGVIIKGLGINRDGLPEGFEPHDVFQALNPPKTVTDSGQSEVALSYVPVGAQPDSTAHDITLWP
jgi:hypothetical protein